MWGSMSHALSEEETAALAAAERPSPPPSAGRHSAAVWLSRARTPSCPSPDDRRRRGGRGPARAESRGSSPTKVKSRETVAELFHFGSRRNGRLVHRFQSSAPIGQAGRSIL